MLGSADDSFDARTRTSAGSSRFPTALAAAATTTDIYLLDIDKFYYGYASPDEGQGAATSKESYLVLDNDYKRLASPPSSPRSRRCR